MERNKATAGAFFHHGIWEIIPRLSRFMAQSRRHSGKNPQSGPLLQTANKLILQLEVGRVRETREMSMSLAKPFHLLAVSAAFLFVGAIVLGAI